MRLEKNYIKNKSRAFTLIELVVVVTIMFIMTSVVIFNYNNFNDNMLLSNFAYDMSLTIRQAQVYGIAVKEKPGSSVVTDITDATSHDQNFSSAYGVHFDSSAGTASSFRLFVDTGTGVGVGNNSPADGAYESTESLQTYYFQKGIKINALYVDVNGVSTPVTTLDVTFLRPNPQAIIYAYNGSAGNPTCDPYNDVYCGSATIVLQNANGSVMKAVSISSTGQITVKAWP